MDNEREARIFTARGLLSKDRWDGKLIYTSRDCPDCPYLERIDDKDYCFWGIAYKLLVLPDKKLRKCSKKEKQSPRPPMTEWRLEYLRKQTQTP